MDKKHSMKHNDQCNLRERSVWGVVKDGFRWKRLLLKEKRVFAILERVLLESIRSK